MKLKYYAIMLSILTAIEIAVLIMSKQGIPITDISISQIGTLEGNYLFYVLSTFALVLMFTLFLHKLYSTLNHKPKRILYFIPALTLIALLLKAEPPTLDTPITAARAIHIVLFVIAGILALIIVVDLNTIVYSNKNRQIRKTTKAIPTVAFLGTLVLFILIGMNVITELAYIGTMLSWVNTMGASV